MQPEDSITENKAAQRKGTIVRVGSDKKGHWEIIAFIDVIPKKILLYRIFQHHGFYLFQYLYIRTICCI